MMRVNGSYSRTDIEEVARRLGWWDVDYIYRLLQGQAFDPDDMQFVLRELEKVRPTGDH